MVACRAKHPPMIYKTRTAMKNGVTLASVRLEFDNGYYYVRGHINGMSIQTFPMHKLSFAAARYEEYELRLNVMEKL